MASGLAFAARQRPDQLVGVAHLDPDVLHLLAGDPRRLLAVEALERREPLGRLVAEEEVAADAHQRHHRQVLVDRRDADVERVAGRVEADRLAVDGERPLVGRVDAGQHLDQRRLAGAVVAEEAVDLPGADLERDVLDGDDRAEVLRDVARLEQRGGVRGGRSGCGLHLLLLAQRRPAKRRRIQLLRTTATSRSVPSATRYQSALMFANTIPIWAIPRASAPIAAPATDP